LSGTAVARLGFSAVSMPKGGSSNPGHGSTFDAAYSVGAQAGTGSVGWLTALLLSHLNGRAPLDATSGCVICTDGNHDTIKTFTDVSSYSIADNFLKFANGVWAGNGQLTLASTVSPLLILQTTGANPAFANINDGGGGNQAGFNFLDAGILQWQLIKQTNKAFL